jgi:hypothetical protein
MSRPAAEVLNPYVRNPRAARVNPYTLHPTELKMSLAAQEAPSAASAKHTRPVGDCRARELARTAALNSSRHRNNSRAPRAAEGGIQPLTDRFLVLRTLTRRCEVTPPSKFIYR